MKRLYLVSKIKLNVAINCLIVILMVSSFALVNTFEFWMLGFVVLSPGINAFFISKFNKPLESVGKIKTVLAVMSKGDYHK